MKNILKKLALVVLMAALAGNAAFLAIAEEETSAPEALMTVEPTAEPTVEATVEPAVEPAVEATVEATVEPAVEPTVEAAEEPTAEPASVAFAGEVKVKLENKGDIFFGDIVMLRAEVLNANAEYSIRWELNREGAGDNWVVIDGETSVTYSFEITEENAGYAYRAVLVVAE